MTWRLDLDPSPPAWRPQPADPQAVLCFSTRRGGVSEPPYHTLNLGRSAADDPDAVAVNRRRLLESLGLDPAHLATAGQVHGAEVVEVRAPGHEPGCDALLTREPGLPLAIGTADCLPLLYVAPGAVAAAHAGWRGIRAGIPARTLSALCAAAGVDPGAIAVHFGPCIRACCYPVGAEVAEQFPEPARIRDRTGWRLDLVAAARLQLERAGALPEHLQVVPSCTCCEADWYFSHRRDRGVTGRHWAIAALRPRS